MEAIQKQAGIHIQHQIRNNAEEVKNTLNDLYNWEKEMKDKEQKLKVEKESKDEKPHPIRSHIATMEQMGVKADANTVNPLKKKLVEADEERDNRTVKAETFKELGNKHVKLGNYKEAILEYTAAINAYDGDPKYFTNRALCYLRLKKFHECIADCDRAIELDSLTVKAYYRRMQANEILGFNTQALKDCTTVLMIDSKNADAKASLKRINQRLQKTGAVPKGYPSTDSITKIEGPQFSPLRNNMVDILPANKPSYSRSKKPLKKVPIIDVIGPKDGKNFENSNIQISDEVIDKLFNSECGSYEEVKKSPTTESIPVIEDVEKDSNRTSPDVTVEKPLKVSKLEAELSSATKIRPLPPPPTSTAQFYSNWKDLSAEQRYQYFKSIETPQLNKVLGAGFDSETLTDILMILKECYVPNKENACEALLQISKNDRLPILSLLLSNEDKEALSNVIEYIKENNGESDHINLIRKSFSLE